MTASRVQGWSRVGTFHHVISQFQNTVQLMTAGVVQHVTNLTPGSGVIALPLVHGGMFMNSSKS